MLNGQEWKKAKEAGAIQPAGQLCPTPKPYSDDPNAPPVKIVPEEEWTEGMKNIAAYAKFLARELMGVEIDVRSSTRPTISPPATGQGSLDFNLLRLGHRWFEQGVTEEVDRLLIHEFGHQYSGDHLSEEYHEALCRLGSQAEAVGPGEAGSGAAVHAVRTTTRSRLGRLIWFALTLCP